jgi:hypothetical protein
MIPIHFKFDARYQQVKRVEYSDDYLFEDGKEYYLSSECVDIGIEDFDLDTDGFDESTLIDE